MITMFDADLLLTLMCKLLSSVYQAFFYTERSPKERSQIGPVNSLYQSAVLGPFSFEGGTVTDQRSLEMLADWIVSNELLRAMTTFSSKMVPRRTEISSSDFSVLDLRCCASGPRGHRF